MSVWKRMAANDAVDEQWKPMEKSLECPKFGLFAKGQWYSRCGPWSSSTSITWELIRNANSPALPPPPPDLLNQKLRGWGTVTCLKKSSKWLWHTLSSRTLAIGMFPSTGMTWLDLCVLVATWTMDQRGRNWRHGRLKRNESNGSLGSFVFYLYFSKSSM